MHSIEVSSDPARLQLDTVHAFLKRSAWAAHRTRETLEKSVQNSLCFGAYAGDRQVAFARVVTDRCTFSYLCDVFVDEEFRGQGISRLLMTEIMRHPDLQQFRRFTLATKTAHGLYQKFGFKNVNADRFMEITNDFV